MSVQEKEAARFETRRERVEPISRWHICHHRCEPYRTAPSSRGGPTQIKEHNWFLCEGLSWCHNLELVWCVKALVWFWIIDETLVLTSILSVCRLNEVGTYQVMEQVMIMVMTTRWSSAQLGKEEREKQNPMKIKAKVLLRVLVLVIKTP